MGLLDLFKSKPDPLLEWLQTHYAGRAHGREMSVVPEYHGGSGICLAIVLATSGEPEGLQIQRPESYLDAAGIAALPSITAPDWPARMEGAQGLKLGAGFVLDPDFNHESPLVRARGRDLVAYLERFSSAVDQINYEPPVLRMLVDRKKATQPELERDIERAHLLAAFLEQPL